MNISTPSIPRAVAAKLGYYVYLYVNPLDDSVFYVGKGRNCRALAHLHAGDQKKVTGVIREIRAAGEEPRIEILAHGLGDAETAFRVEAAAIDLLGLDNLSNLVRGKGVKFGRMPLQDLVAHYAHQEAKIREPAILIRINKLYRYGMTNVGLYDATRGVWRIGPKREKVELAFAVFEGVVREVYRIAEWLPAGSTFSSRRDGRGVEAPGRWEFVGAIADEPVRKRYVNRYVGHLPGMSGRSPVVYVNVG